MADAIVNAKTCRRCGESFTGERCVKCNRAYFARKRADPVFLKKSKAYHAARYQANKEQHLEQCRARRAAKPELVKATFLAWREANREKLKKSKAEYYVNNKAREKARMAEYRARNDIAEKSRARAAAWRAANPERVRAADAAYAAAHPEVRRIHSNNYVSRKRKSGGRLSSGLALKLFKLQRGMCVCCGKPLGTDYHLDHRVPVSRGGLNVDSNMQLLTRLCNLQKKAKDPIEFMQERGFLL